MNDDAVLTVMCSTCSVSLSHTTPQVAACWLVTHWQCEGVSVINETLFNLEAALLVRSALDELGVPR